MGITTVIGTFTDGDGFDWTPGGTFGDNYHSVKTEDENGGAFSHYFFQLAVGPVGSYVDDGIAGGAAISSASEGLEYLQVAGSGDWAAGNLPTEVNIGPQLLDGSGAGGLPTIPGGVTVSRSLYVPPAASGEGWIRFLDSFTNNTAATQTFVVRLGGFVPGNSYPVVATSSGDSTWTTADSWLLIDDNDGSDNDPILLVYGDGSLRPDFVGRAPSPSSGTGDQVFDIFFELTLAPGETKSLLSFGAQNETPGDAVAQEVPVLTDPTAAQFAGLSLAELATVVNYAIDLIPAANAGLTLDEGTAQTITAAMLDYDHLSQPDTAIRYTVTSTTNGVVRLNGTPLAPNGSFTQDDVNNGRVDFHHNGSETATAGFGFEVSDGAGGSETGQSFAVAVDPVNDAPAIAVEGDTLDVALTDGFGTAGAALVRIHLADGAGGYVPTTVALPDDPSQMATGDFDGDGDLDLAIGHLFTGSGNSNVSLLLGDGEGGFTPGAIDLGPDQLGVMGIAAGDLDEDGDLDLTVLSAIEDMTVLLNDGAAGFTAAGSHETGNSSPFGHIALGDMNGDGDLDAVTANGMSATIGVLLGEGDGNFALWEHYGAVANILIRLDLGDIDGDGDLDVVAADVGQSSIVVMTNDGTGFLTPSHFVVGVDQRGVALGDMDSDGDLDIVYSAPTDTGEIRIRANDGTGGFGIEHSINLSSTSTNPRFLTLADMDRDGDLDIVVSSTGGGPGYVLLNEPALGFAGFAEIELAGTSHSQGLAVGDFNHRRLTDEDVAIVFDAAGGNAITLADPDETGDATLVVAAAHGTLTLANASGLTSVAGDGSASVTLIGTIAALNAALDGLSYLPEADYNGADRLDLTLTDSAGGAASYVIPVTVDPVGDVPVARPDAFTIPESGSITGGDLFAANGAGADTDPDDPLVIAAVNGAPGNVGVQIVLASGALLTVNANGTFDYDPNGAFLATPAAGSGASNTPGQDSFTYSLGGGNTVTVAIALTGLDGNDLLRGTAGADLLAGGIGHDVYFVEIADDQVLETAGGGSDRVLAQASYTLTPGSEVELLTTANHAGTGALNLTGNELANIIYGNAGDNVLNGGGGADAMVGWAGNDWFFADSAADLVVEADGEGSDRLFARVSYRLAPGSAVEWMSTDSHRGTAAINLTGNERANTIYGNDGNNVLNGAGGADAMIGWKGDDWFFVDSVADLIVEADGEGSDRLFASVSYTLNAGAEVEWMSTDNHEGIAAIDLAGNARANTLYGNAGDNRLDGAGGVDAMFGGKGNDWFFTDSAADIVVETGGEGSDRLFASASYTLSAGVEVEILSTDFHAGTAAIDLIGNHFANIIHGNDGANLLDGKGGHDVLVGRAGNDRFAFTTAPGAGNVDLVCDFVSADDTILLDDAMFTRIGPVGALDADAFHLGAGARDGEDRILYDQATGRLFYDADGNGAGAAILFATLQGGPALDAGDFLVI